MCHAEMFTVRSEAKVCIDAAVLSLDNMLVLECPSCTGWYINPANLRFHPNTRSISTRCSSSRVHTLPCLSDTVTMRLSLALVTLLPFVSLTVLALPSPANGARDVCTCRFAQTDVPLMFLTERAIALNRRHSAYEKDVRRGMWGLIFAACQSLNQGC